MKETVYIESSIISYLTSKPARDLIKAARQSITLEWWEIYKNDYEVFVSALVEEEISGGDPIAAKLRMKAISDLANIAITMDSQKLAIQLIESKVVPVGSERDALHIAITATQGIDYLLTWNFKHINNASIKKQIIRVIEANGYEPPILCSPEELGERNNGQ